jgi:malignant T-cell-amplified sequence
MPDDKHRIPVAPRQKLKSSVQRGLRQSLSTTYPLLTPYLDEVLPKKLSLEQMKLPEFGGFVYLLGGEPVFYQQDVGPGKNVLLPHLKVVHKFPQAFPSVRIDRGAIRFVLSGATLMAPGLTSKGGRLPADGAPSKGEGGGASTDGGADGEKGVEHEGLDADGRWSRELEKGEPVVITAEGKEEACAVGVLLMGTKEVKEKGKGPVVEDAHFLGDGLWALTVD